MPGPINTVTVPPTTATQASRYLLGLVPLIRLNDEAERALITRNVESAIMLLLTAQPQAPKNTEKLAQSQVMIIAEKARSFLNTVEGLTGAANELCALMNETTKTLKGTADVLKR